MMKKNIFWVGVVACLISQPGLQAQQKSRPNIIYIMSDDHAYQAISAYGYGLNNTPNIDKSLCYKLYLRAKPCRYVNGKTQPY